MIIIFSKIMSFIKFCIILTMVIVGATVYLAPDLVNATKDFGLSLVREK